jgi:hypothetical protein
VNAERRVNADRPVTAERPPRRPPRRNLQRRRLIAGILLLIVVFLLGIAFGKALNDNPKPGGSTTFVRTFFPLSSQEGR